MGPCDLQDPGRVSSSCLWFKVSILGIWQDVTLGEIKGLPG